MPIRISLLSARRSVAGARSASSQTARTKAPKRSEDSVWSQRSNAHDADALSTDGYFAAIDRYVRNGRWATVAERDLYDSRNEVRCGATAASEAPVGGQNSVTYASCPDDTVLSAGIGVSALSGSEVNELVALS